MCRNWFTIMVKLFEQSPKILEIINFKQKNYSSNNFDVHNSNSHLDTNEFLVLKFLIR